MLRRGRDGGDTALLPRQWQRSNAWGCKQHQLIIDGPDVKMASVNPCRLDPAIVPAPSGSGVYISARPMEQRGEERLVPPFCSMFCLVQCVWSIATAGKCPRVQRPTGHSCTLCSISVAGLVMPPQLCTKSPQVLVPTNVDHQGGVAPRRATRRLVPPLVLFHNQIDVLPWPSVAHVCWPSCPVAT